VRAASLLGYGMVFIRTSASFGLTSTAGQEQRLVFGAMVSRKRNKGKERRALKAEKERAAKAEVIQKDYFPVFVQEEAAKVDDVEKNSFGSEDISYDEAEDKDTGAKMATLARTRRGRYINGKCVTCLDKKSGCNCKHVLAPSIRSQPHGFVSALIDEFNLIYGRLHVLRDSDAITFAMQTLSAAFKFTQEKYDTVWYDRSNLSWTASFFLANGTQHLLDGNNNCARECAFISYAFGQRVAVGFDRSRAAFNMPKLCELLKADTHTLVSFFRKRISCPCLDELYKKVKSIPKIGLCYNPNCKHGGVVTRSKTKCCSQCRGANYCSPRCQAAHWPRHRKGCIEIAAVLSKLRE